MKITSKTINYTVPTVDDLSSMSGQDNDTVIVTDKDRGGVFIYRTDAGLDDGGITFNKWVRQYEGPVNVKWFGAKFNDPIYDSSDACKKAIAFLGSTGGIVYIPTNEGFIYANISISQGGVILAGDTTQTDGTNINGGVIPFDKDEYAIAFVYNGTKLDGSGLSYINLYGLSTQGSDTSLRKNKGLLLDGAYKCTFNNVSISYFNEEHLTYQSTLGHPTGYNQFTNCSIDQSYGKGLWAHSEDGSDDNHLYVTSLFWIGGRLICNSNDANARRGVLDNFHLNITATYVQGGKAVEQPFELSNGSTITGDANTIFDCSATDDGTHLPMIYFTDIASTDAKAVQDYLKGGFPISGSIKFSDDVTVESIGLFNKYHTSISYPRIIGTMGFLTDGTTASNTANNDYTLYNGRLIPYSYAMGMAFGDSGSKIQVRETYLKVYNSEGSIRFSNTNDASAGIISSIGNDLVMRPAGSDETITITEEGGIKLRIQPADTMSINSIFMDEDYVLKFKDSNGDVHALY